MSPLPRLRASAPPPEPAREVADRVVAAAVVLAVAGAVGQTALGLVNGLLLEHRFGWLDPDREFTVFSWASSVATFVAAFAAFLLGLVRGLERARLFLLAGVLAFFSLDDLLVVHEPLTRKVFVDVLGLPLGLGARLFAVLYLPLLAAAAVILLLQAAKAPVRAGAAIVAGLACLVAAVGLELVNGVLSALGLIVFRQPLDVVIATTEEGLELAGWILVGGGLAAATCAWLVAHGLTAGTRPSIARRP